MSPFLPRHGEENAKAEDKQDIIHYIGNVNTAVGNSRHPLFPPPRPGYEDITPETPTFREPNRARAFGEIIKAWLNHHGDSSRHMDTMPGRYGEDKKPFGYRRHHHDIGDDADTMLGGDKKPFGYRRHHHNIGDDADTMLGGDTKPFGYRRHHHDIGDDTDTMLGGDKKLFGYRRHHHDIGDDVEHRRNHHGDILRVLGGHKTPFEWGRHNFGHSPQRRINEMDDPAGGFGEDEKPFGSKPGSYGKYWDDTADNKEGFQDALGDMAEDKEYEEESDTADMEMAAMGM